jgi:hypothetical protein
MNMPAVRFTTPAVPASVAPIVPTAPAPRFTAAEVKGLHADDRRAAAAVVGIMISIFCLALIAYTVVASIATS